MENARFFKLHLYLFSIIFFCVGFVVVDFMGGGIVGAGEKNNIWFYHFHLLTGRVWGR